MRRKRLKWVMHETVFELDFNYVYGASDDERSTSRGVFGGDIVWI